MAINHIDQIRNAMPQHFMELDHLLPMDDYLVIPTNEPGDIKKQNEGDEIFEKRTEDEFQDPAGGLEEALDGIDEFEPLEDPTPEELEGFGGHPGGLTKDSQDPKDPNQEKSTIIERLAFYLPYHCYPKYWGIYILPEGILTIRREMRKHFNFYNKGPRYQTRLAKRILYHHEYYHHMIESFGSRLEAVLNQPCYLQGFSPRYKATNLTSSCFEETCANSYAREKTLEQLHHGRNPSRDRMREGINRWFSNQPSGYSEASKTTASWKSDLRPSLFEDYVNHSPGLQGTRAQPSPQNISPIWESAGFFDRGIGNINSRISYLVKKNSPLTKRLPLDVRTCIKTRNFKKKLKAHGIARLKREGRSHEIWEPWLGGQSVPIPRHDGMDLPKGTLRGILKQLGVDMNVEQFLAL